MLSEQSLQYLACLVSIKEAAQLHAPSTPTSTKWLWNHMKLLDFEVHSTTTELCHKTFPMVTFWGLRPFSGCVHSETVPKLLPRLPGLSWCQQDSCALHRAEEDRLPPPVHPCHFCKVGSKVFACSPWNQWVLLKHGWRPQEVLRSKWAQFTSSSSALKQQHLLHLIKSLFVESSEQPQLSHFSSSPPPQTTGDIILQGFYKLYLEITSFL